MKAQDIQDVKFSKSMSGYRPDEVDEFCDKVYEDYTRFAATVLELEEKVARLEARLRESETSAESINTVLISAQKLADSIVSEAKTKADEIIENANNEAENIKQRTKKALEEIDAVITEQRRVANKEAEEILAEAARKSEGMILAAKDSVAREQLLFDKLRAEVSAFKKEIKNAYKAHLESLSALPEEVPVTPEEAAVAIEDIINNEPDLYQFIERKEPIAPVSVEAAPATDNTVIFEPIAEEQTAPVPEVSEPVKEVMDDMAAGFIVTPIDDDEE